MTRLDIHESKSLCEWLMEKGLSLKECARFLSFLETGESFACCLLGLFIDRKEECKAALHE
jgi:hypothetical protein